jgi:hypothetical protein
VGGDHKVGSAAVTGLVGVRAGGGPADYGGSRANVSSTELVGNQAVGARHDTAGGAAPGRHVGQGLVGDRHRAEAGPVAVVEQGVQGLTHGQSTRPSRK